MFSICHLQTILGYSSHFRLYLAALHFNENAGRLQAITAAGDSQYKITFPKWKKGDHVVNMVKTNYTTGQQLHVIILSIQYIRHSLFGEQVTIAEKHFILMRGGTGTVADNNKLRSKEDHDGSG